MEPGYGDRVPCDFVACSHWEHGLNTVTLSYVQTLNSTSKKQLSEARMEVPGSIIPTWLCSFYFKIAHLQAPLETCCLEGIAIHEYCNWIVCEGSRKVEWGPRSLIHREHAEAWDSFSPLLVSRPCHRSLKSHWESLRIYHSCVIKPLK